MKTNIIYRNLFEYKKNFFSNYNERLNLNVGNNDSKYGMYTWGNLIDILSYYLDPRFILTNNNYDFGDYDNPYLHMRTDTNGVKISNNSCTSFIGMLLPEDIRTFKIKWEDVQLQLENADKLDTLKVLRYLEDKVNRKLWTKLEDVHTEFKVTLNHLVRDYLNYGTSTAIYDNGKWKYIPFLNSAIGEINGHTSLAFFEHKHDFEDQSGYKEIYTHNLYHADSKGTYTLYQTTNNDINNSITPNKVEEKATDKKFNIIISKMDDTGATYGIGCGMQVLNSIIDCNLYNNCLRLNNISVYHPCVMVSIDYDIAKIMNSYTGKTIFNAESIDQTPDCLEKINMMPGNVYILKRDPDVVTTTQQPMSVLSQPQLAYEMFQTMKQATITEIEDKYFLSVLGKLSGLDSGPQKTNDEIQLIAQLAYQQFKGVVEPFYITSVYPMIHKYCTDIVNDVAADFQEEVDKIRSVIDFKPEKFDLEVSNLVTARAKEQENAQFNNWVAMLGSIEAIDDETKQKILIKASEYIK